MKLAKSLRIMISFLSGTLALIVVASSLPLQASIIEYTDGTAWATAATAATGAPVLTISLAGLGGAPDQAYPSGLTVDGVTFTGSDSYLEVRTSPNVLYGPPDGSLGTCDPRWLICPPGGNITVTLPPGVIAVGWDFSGFDPPDDVTVVFPDSTMLSESGPGFIGFVSTSPIGSFEIESLGGPVVSNFSFSTPEPSTMSLLIVAATVGLAAMRLRYQLSDRKRSSPHEAASVPR